MCFPITSSGNASAVLNYLLWSCDMEEVTIKEVMVTSHPGNPCLIDFLLSLGDTQVTVVISSKSTARVKILS
ncbi:hypothetical protein A2450_02990 [candidate division WWE3 bacterium RIFOXYC2_FULL_40_11]|uniref:Uncharacterized protein n=1 Tax=candidate division WWE3 bacterium RIFOXYA2_FULL_46_9 TaxID=1802636 RepID=A0A1F4W1I2_UNCKA|nr:MAG: hypothetical protein A2264_00835 [candidate division WWE3 bacterium RIFOXYA2_FULL_46_9]OGC65301.1 MAG: hypothetical protein A2326_04465 [candidate division WWE3 bacterium RIFOXYB2_FULL_41_6]OGC67740.1 MAG: hypothetical protein A2450_02990 [candidate division WWE3 bacterium RIFOXYC2_FULL_40_11]OGC70900.1 MAG: hypothetical protein A2602_03725 [candidate division WWE3 bacterium RIFOXYD1_FULL_40_11]HLD51396.1 hypothetical protein [Patescibacteria group bacterium]